MTTGRGGDIRIERGMRREDCRASLGLAGRFIVVAVLGVMKHAVEQVMFLLARNCFFVPHGLTFLYLVATGYGRGRRVLVSLSYLSCCNWWNCWRWSCWSWSC